MDDEKAKQRYPLGLNSSYIAPGGTAEIVVQPQSPITVVRLGQTWRVKPDHGREYGYNLYGIDRIEGAGVYYYALRNPEYKSVVSMEFWQNNYELVSEAPASVPVASSVALGAEPMPVVGCPSCGYTGKILIPGDVGPASRKLSARADEWVRCPCVTRQESVMEDITKAVEMARDLMRTVDVVSDIDRARKILSDAGLDK